MKQSTRNGSTQTDPVIILPIDVSKPESITSLGSQSNEFHRYTAYKSELLPDLHSPEKQSSMAYEDCDVPPPIPMGKLRKVQPITAHYVTNGLPLQLHEPHNLKKQMVKANEDYVLEDKSLNGGIPEIKKKPLILFRPIYILKESINIYDNNVWEVGDEFEWISDVHDNPNQLSLKHLRTSTNALLDRSLVELDENTPLRLGIRDRGTIECILLKCDARYSYLIHRSDQDEMMYILSVNQHHITKKAFVSHYFICINKENTCFYLESGRKLRNHFFPTLGQLANDARVHDFIPLSKPVDRNLTITEDELWQIDYKQLIIGEKIGAGEFGQVLSGKWKRNGSFGMVDVAIKKLKLNNVASDEFAQEIRAMKLLRNSYLVSLLGISIHPITNEKLIITELMVDGNLQSWLQKQPKFPSNDKLISYCHQICLGMLHLERSNYIHRDLACRNVFLIEDRVKIGDFGMTIISEIDPYYRVSNSQSIGKLPYRWTAPEIFAGKVCTTRSDVWSFGICMIELWSKGRLPYPTIKHSKELVEKIKQGYVHDRPLLCPERYYDIIKNCLEMDPECRPSFKTLTDQFKLLLIDKDDNGSNMKSKTSSGGRLYYNTKEKDASSNIGIEGADQKQHSLTVKEDNYIYADASSVQQYNPSLLLSVRSEHPITTTEDDVSMYEAIPQHNCCKEISLSINNYYSLDSSDKDDEQYSSISPSHLTKPKTNNNVYEPHKSTDELRSSIATNLMESSNAVSMTNDNSDEEVELQEKTEQDTVSSRF